MFKKTFKKQPISLFKQQPGKKLGSLPTSWAGAPSPHHGSALPCLPTGPGWPSFAEIARWLFFLPLWPASLSAFSTGAPVCSSCVQMPTILRES